MTYPLHDKLVQHKAHVEAVSEFLDFLEAQNLHIAKYSGEAGYEQLYTYPMSKGNLIGMFLGIDPIALEAEKRQMLEALKKL